MPYIMLNGKQYGGNGGNYQVAKMSKADYDALSTSQKNDGTLRIVVDSGGNSVNYLSETVAGAKCDDTLTNLLSPTLATTTVNGVDITNNGDGTYTLNGTATAFADIRLSPWGTDHYSECLALKAGTYKLVGTPNGISEFHAHVGLVPNNGVERPTSYYDDGDGFILNHTNENIRYECKIFVNSGAVLNHVTFKPMLTPCLTATYDDFVGYTGGTGRLNSDVALHQRQISRINTDLTEYPITRSGIKSYSGLKGGGHANKITVSITFSSPMPSTDYVMFATLNDLYGDYPYITCVPIIGSRTVNGFDVVLVSTSSNTTTAVGGNINYTAIMNK